MFVFGVDAHVFDVVAALVVEETALRELSRLKHARRQAPMLKSLCMVLYRVSVWRRRSSGASVVLTPQARAQKLDYSVLLVTLLGLAFYPNVLTFFIILLCLSALV